MFSCPEGFYFNGTNRVDVYAVCHDSKWNETYDLDTYCKRKLRFVK